MKADRLLAILLALQNEGKLSTRALAERLEVSERTIVRDMEALSMAGVPIYAERGSKGGWLLANGYRTKLTGMKAEEFASLIMTAHPQLLSDLGIRQHYETALQKLLASSTESMRNDAELIRSRIHIDGAGWHAVADTCPYLSVIQAAVWRGLQLIIHYKRDQETVVRTVHPLGLIAKRSVWYLAAQVETDIRTYRISRIVYAEMVHEPAHYPADFNLAQYWEQSTAQFKQTLPKYDAVVHVREQMLRMLEQNRYVRVLELGNVVHGWREVHVEFATIEHACETVLSLGSSIAVIEPEELRQLVIGELEEASRLYGN